MPAASKKSRSTGPRSVPGKARSSQNAISHGLTSSRVMPDELQLVQQFTQELTRHYKPSSPLEELQIQRIAFCRAKLAKLIDIEMAGREMARRLVQIEPERVMDRLTQFSSQIRAAALKALRGKSLAQSIGLDEPVLKAIQREIRDLVETLESPQDLPRCLPTMCKALMRADFLGPEGGAAEPDHRLMVLVQRITHLFEPAFSLEQKGSFEQLLKRVDASLGSDGVRHDNMVRRYRQGPGEYHEAVMQDLQIVADFGDVQEQVVQVLQSFEEMKSWMMRCADIDPDESERLMKYQNMLERRLSSAIGELLELQRINIK